MTPPTHIGAVDGITDAVHERPCDPHGTFMRQHGDRPGREWSAYLNAYVDGFRRARSPSRAQA